MHRTLFSIWGFILLFLVGCASYPISTDVRLEPEKVYVGRRNQVIVTAKNVTGKNVFVPPYLKVGNDFLMDGVGVKFSRDHEVHLLTGTSIDLHPPRMDVIPPKGTMEYIFYWTPKASEKGGGFLHMALPMSFRPVNPISIEVKQQDEEN